MIEGIPNASKVLVGNKSDLKPVVDKGEAESFAKESGMELVYVSARTGEGFAGLERAIWKELIAKAAV